MLKLFLQHKNCEKKKKLYVFVWLVFPLSYTRYVLHYLIAASASFQEENRTVRLESMREKKEQRIKKR